ncbi:MAG: GTP-binding protein [Deltaproteobacteria bacterium]|nr:GTP-binding protein [Deltaproteobacteria bacterium]
MIQKKIFMIGAFAVGKTSLVRRFVKSVFNERYLTTVGVKVDKKVAHVDGQDVTLVIWDLEGQDRYHNVRSSYFRGASGYLLVADGSNRATVDVAADLQVFVESQIGKLPYMLLLNKADLTDSWEVAEEQERRLSEAGVIVRRTSAKTGEGVEEAFLLLSRLMLTGYTNAQSSE